MKLDFHAMFAAHVAATEKVWAHDRTESLGASETFGCIRKAWFTKRGKQFGFAQDEDDEQSWGATRRGDLIEEHYVVPGVRDNLPGKAKLLFAGRQQKTLFAGFNSATPDGIIIGVDDDALAEYGVPSIGSDCIMLEIKSIDPRVSLHEEKTIHRGQTQVQMGLVRETTEFRPNYAVILYVDASFLDNIKVFVVEYDESAWAAAKGRADLVFATDDPATLMAEGKIDKSCQYCPFQSACATVTIGAIPPDDKKRAKDESLAADMQPLIDDYKQTKNAFEQASKAFEEAKVAIKEAMSDIHLRKLNPKSLPWSVSWYGMPGQKALDRGKIIQALGVENLDDYMTQGDPFDVIRVTFSD